MSDKITSSQIFLFLAQQANWKEEADTNKKDPLTKGEMREYLNSEAFKDFAGVKIQDVSAKTFNDFWAKLDSNVNNNRLDTTELGKADETISKYEQLNNKISALKSSVSGTISANRLGQWEGRLAELLMTKVDNNEITIDELLNNDNEINKAFNRATAEVLADQYKDSAAVKSLISNAGIDYDITKDETLTNIISQYIDKKLLAVGENDTVAQLTAADIDKEIKNLIANYLKEANLESETVKANPAVDLSTYGYDKNVLNDAQKAVLVKNISTALSTEKSKFSGYEKEFDEVLNKYIENYIATNNVTATGNQSLFTTLSGKVNDIKSAFIASDDYKNLKNTVDVYKKYRDNMEEAFKTALKEALGTTDDAVLEACKTDAAYAKVLQSIIVRLNAKEEGLYNSDGSINWTKVQEALIEAVKVEFASGTSGEFGAMEVDFKNNLSDLEKAKEKAIAYCDAAKAKGGEYADAVTSVFGNDHKSAINAYDSTIKLSNKMQELFDKINELVAIENMTWDDGLKGKEFKQGIKTDFTVSTNIEGATYKAKNATNCTVTISGSTVSLTPDEKATSASVDIVIMKDGKEITTKSITVEVSPKTNQDIVNAASFSGVGDPSGGHLEVFCCNGINDNTQVSASDFKTMYNGNAMICLNREKDDHWSLAKERLSNLLNMIGGALINAGLDTIKIQKAIQTVGQRFDKENRYESNDNTEGTDLCRRAASGMQSGLCATDGIVRYKDKKRRDYHVYMVSFRALVDAILEEYKKL